jgi:hypothetical protein
MSLSDIANVSRTAHPVALIPPILPALTGAAAWRPRPLAAQAAEVEQFLPLG